MTRRWPGQHRREEKTESPPGDTETIPFEITHAQMSVAVSAGAVVSLGRGFPWVARYLDAWWIEYEDGWLRITDEHSAAEFDDLTKRLAAAAFLGSIPAPKADT
jgi:hypothetical protein